MRQCSQDLRHARRLHEAVVRDHANEGVGHALDLDALVARHAGRVLGLDGEDDVALVQHAVVLEVVHQRRRRGIGVAGQEHGRAGHPMRRLGLELAHQPVELGLVLARRLARLAEPRTQVSTRSMIATAIPSGSQPPSGILSMLAARKACSISSSGTISGARLPHRPAPASPDHEERHQAVDHHRRGDRQAVGCGQLAGAAEGQGHEQHADEQQLIDARQVDLPRDALPTCGGWRAAAADRAGSPGA